MRITYVTRSFLDYRIPVFEELNRMANDGLEVIYSADYVPERVNDRIQSALGVNAIGMRGEKRIGPNEFPDFANSAFRFVYQPGLLRKIAETKPDVLIADGFFQWTTFALGYKLKHGIPLVVCYERTSYTERNAQWFRTAYRRMVMRFIDAMCCNGKLCVEYSKSLGMPKERITTGHMVADTEELEREVNSVTKAETAKIRQQWENPACVFLTVGKLNKRKGIAELLAGWQKLEQEVPGDWLLVLIGKGPDEARLKEKSKTRDLKQVIFHGSVDYDRLAKYYAAADVLVMPTLEDNWSLVVPEAMACGLPVVCSIYNGCYPELIKSGENGWIFNPRSEEETFAALKKCIDYRENLRKMGAVSREIVASHSPAHAVKSIIHSCEMAIKHRAG